MIKVRSPLRTLYSCAAVLHTILTLATEAGKFRDEYRRFSTRPVCFVIAKCRRGKQASQRTNDQHNYHK